MSTQTMVENFGERAKKALKERGSTQRWLTTQLEKHGIFLNDSMLSNRFGNRYKWTKREIEAIQKILEIELNLV